jgi:hypothetical protein
MHWYKGVQNDARVYKKYGLLEIKLLLEFECLYNMLKPRVRKTE